MLVPLYNSKMYYVVSLDSYLYVGRFDYIQIKAMSITDDEKLNDILDSFNMTPCKNTGIDLNNDAEVNYALTHF